jgi:hypothetical protein
MDNGLVFERPKDSIIGLMSDRLCRELLEVLLVAQDQVHPGARFEAIIPRRMDWHSSIHSPQM